MKKVRHLLHTARFAEERLVGNVKLQKMGEQSETILYHFSTESQGTLRLNEREYDFKCIFEHDKLLKLFRGGRQGDE